MLVHRIARGWATRSIYFRKNLRLYTKYEHNSPNVLLSLGSYAKYLGCSAWEIGRPENVQSTCRCDTGVGAAKPQTPVAYLLNPWRLFVDVCWNLSFRLSESDSSKCNQRMFSALNALLDTSGWPSGYPGNAATKLGSPPSARCWGPPTRSGKGTIFGGRPRGIATFRQTCSQVDLQYRLCS